MTTDENDALVQVRALAESKGMVRPCPEHGRGRTAAIAAGCDWCAAYGVDQDWREALLKILNGGYPEFLGIPPEGIGA